MQKNLNFFFVHYSQKRFHPLNPGLLGRLHQHPPGTPPAKDAARVPIYPPLYLQRVSLRYPGEVCPLRRPPPNHAVAGEERKMLDERNLQAIVKLLQEQKAEIMHEAGALIEVNVIPKFNFWWLNQRPLFIVSASEYFT